MKYSKELHDVVRRNKDVKDMFVINEGGYFKQYNIAEIAQALLDEIERLYEQARWIPVSEKLPEIVEENGMTNSVFVKYNPKYAPDCGSEYSVVTTYYLSLYPDHFESWKYPEPPEEK